MEVAEKIRDGELPSPTQLGGMTLWSLRITGTGMSYRSGIEEYVWRSPGHYLTPEFLQRCNGVPLVWEHPEKSILDSEEFGNRIIGTVMLPFVKDQDVWAVCRVYDETAIKAMTESQLSTSPAVVFRPSDGNKLVELGNGKHILIEGIPSYLDHLAVCYAGVWDKGGDPNGVQNDTLQQLEEPLTPDEKVADMSEEDKAAADRARKDSEDKAKEIEAKKDADAGQKLDKLLMHLDSMAQRMDSLEMDAKARRDAEEMAMDRARKDKARADAEEHEEWKKSDADMCAKDDEDEAKEIEEHLKKGETKEMAADKARKDRRARVDARRKDAEEKAEKEKEEEEKKKADAARADSAALGQNAELVRMLAELKAEKAVNERRLADLETKTRPVPEEDRALFADAQAHWDIPYMSLGQRAPRRMDGETLIAYRGRLASGVKRHCREWKDIVLGQLKPELLDIAEKKIYADAIIAANTPDDLEPGQLREIHKIDPSTGQRTTTFVGNGTFIGALKRPSRRLIGINTKAGA
jgi:hypothetical protein